MYALCVHIERQSLIRGLSRQNFVLMVLPRLTRDRVRRTEPGVRRSALDRETDVRTRAGCSRSRGQPDGCEPSGICCTLAVTV
jgi:hypothetical protein